MVTVVVEKGLGGAWSSVWCDGWGVVQGIDHGGGCGGDWGLVMWGDREGGHNRSLGGVCRMVWVVRGQGGIGASCGSVVRGDGWGGN